MLIECFGGPNNGNMMEVSKSQLVTGTQILFFEPTKAQKLVSYISSISPLDITASIPKAIYEVVNWRSYNPNGPSWWELHYKETT